MSSVQYHVANPTVTQAGLQAAAAAGHTSIRGIKTVIKVETNGKAVDSAGRLTMLFEPHIFYKHLAAAPASLAAAVEQGLAYKSQGERPYPKDSYPRFEAACGISVEAACASASWGMPQVLGSNFDDVGFDSAKELVEFMAISADNQVLCMGKFVKANGLDDELNSQNWKGFARGYNGKNYAINKYDTKLAAAWAFFGGTPTTIETRVDPDPGAKAPAFMGLPEIGPVPAARPDDGFVLQDGQELPRPPVPGPEVANPPLPGAAAPVVKAPAVVDPQPAGSDPTVFWVQTRLRELGYFEVGVADGLLGSRTTGAVLAFRHDNDMPLNPAISDDLKLALITATPRAVDPDRATATVKTLKASSDILKTTAKAKMLSWATGTFGVVTAAISGTSSNLADANSTLGQFKAIFADVPGWAWGVAAVLVAFVVWTQTRKVEEKRVEMYKTGQAT